jgi:outer membrane pore protein E
MKNKLIYFRLLFACIFCTGGVLNAQSEKPCTAGIYKTEQDFIHNRLSHKINTGDKGNKFRFLFPADLKLTIKMETPDSTMEFKPGSVYGYQLCGKRYRYYPGGDLLAQEDFYGVEEEGGLIIYSSVHVSGDEVFYSRDLSSPIRRLTMKNLEEDFAAYPDFIASVKKMKKEELPVDLSRKDEKGRYEVNKLYALKVNGKKTK